MSELADALTEGLEALLGSQGSGGEGETFSLPLPNGYVYTIWGLLDQVESSYELDGEGLERPREDANLFLLRSQNTTLEAALLDLGFSTLRTGWKIKRIASGRTYKVEISTPDSVGHQVQLSEYP
jgi:hypothetical protein